MVISMQTASNRSISPHWQKIGCLRLLTGLIGVTLGLAAAAWLLALGAWWVRGEWTRLANAGPVSPAEALMVGCCAAALA